MGLRDRIGRLKEGLTRTREGLMGKIARLVIPGGAIDEALLARVEEILIAGDVGADVSAAIVAAIRERAQKERAGDAGVLPTLVRDEIRRQCVPGDEGGESDPFHLPPDRPFVILVVGINGVGKTTTVGKLSAAYVQAGKKVMVAAADTFRAAANEQLEIWARRAGAEIVRQGPGADPAAVAYDAVSAAQARGTDVVIIDTAGRLHTKVNLMEELKKISRVVQKSLPGAPHEVFLVIDASTGQNAMQQARQFGAAVGVTGLILTKVDGTAKGGIVLSISREMNIPVRFIGVGEGIDDLQPFDGKAFVEALIAT
jgi:fused signal recognition particle receptor